MKVSILSFFVIPLVQNSNLFVFDLRKLSEIA